MNGRICLVTGASSGIGKRTALALAQKGATLILLCRNEQRALQTKQELFSATQNASIEILLADLSSQSSIRQAAEQFMTRHSRLHVLVNNAGIAVRQKNLSVDGIEMTFATNHLAPFLLTNLLLSSLAAGSPSRVINVSSEAHRNARLDFGNLQGEKKFTGFGAYCITKLCNILFTRELAEKYPRFDVTANAVHPGYLYTDIFREAPGYLRFLVRLTAGNPDLGAEAILHLIESTEVANISGKYFNRKKLSAPSSAACDKEAAVRLWKKSAELTRLESVI